MRKVLKTLLLAGFLLCLAFALPANGICAGEKSTQQPLIVYFSQSGNTAELARMLQKMTNGQLLQIQTVKKYPEQYKALTEEAKKELENKVRPAITTKLDDPASVSTIFLGFPNWWSSMPMPVWTFIEENKLNGKTIIPFVTHGGGGLGNIMADLKKLCPDSKILKPFAVSGTRASSSQGALEEWLKSLNLAANK